MIGLNRITDIIIALYVLLSICRKSKKIFISTLERAIVSYKASLLAIDTEISEFCTHLSMFSCRKSLHAIIKQH